MEMILTGDFLSAVEAERHGLCSKVFPTDSLVDEAVITAKRIASMSYPIVQMAKDCVNEAFESNLHDGCRFEKQVF